MDKIGVVIPTGGEAWAFVARRFIQYPRVAVQESASIEGHMLLAPESPDLWERPPPRTVKADEAQPVASAEVVVPLAGGPEVIPGLWDTGGEEGMLFIANPDGANVEL